MSSSEVPSIGFLSKFDGVTIEFVFEFCVGLGLLTFEFVVELS